ncbi:hypothetical protein Gotur_000392 [Gossypium turneri]
MLRWLPVWSTCTMFEPSMLIRDWSIVYDMLSGKNNSGFGWDEHRQLVDAEDALTAIYAKDQAIEKDAQTAADIIEEIDVEDVATTNTHEKRNDFYGCEANVSLDDMDLSATQPQPNRNHGDSTFSKMKKKRFLMQVIIFLLLHFMMLPLYWWKTYGPLALKSVGVLPLKC